MEKAHPFIVLTVGGSDPTGGAGIQGDLKTFAAHGAYGMSVVAAVTAQDAGGVREVEGVRPSLVASQLAATCSQVEPRAVKTGMLFDPEVARTVGRFLAPRSLPLVVDPVLAASAGGSLSRPGLIEALVEELFPQATVVTPNLDEAALFLGRRIQPGEEGDAAAALRQAWGCAGVLVKGGHSRGPTATDHLATRQGLRSFSLPRVETRHGHGTGCALSASIAVRLGRGETLEEAVLGAKAYVHRALTAAFGLGEGRGPVRHDVPTEGAA